MRWPSDSHLAHVLGTAASQEGVSPEGLEELKRFCLSKGFEPFEIEPRLAEIAACARARNEHIAEVLKARGDLFGKQPQRRTWSTIGAAKIRQDLAGGSRRRRA